MSLRTAATRFHATRQRALFDTTDGITFRGVLIPGRTTSPMHRATIADGGVEVEITLACTLLQSTFTAQAWNPPTRWEHITIRGQAYAIADMTRDDKRAEYRLHLTASPNFRFRSLT